MNIILRYLSCNLLAAVGYCQSGVQSEALPQVVVTRNADTVTVDCRDPRPLREATVAVRSEYGWVIDYEDPIYEGTELVDNASPIWRQSHPFERGLTKPAGEQFVFSVHAPSVADLQGGAAEGPLLRDMIRQYSKTRNPGLFEVVELQNKRFAIVGRQRSGGHGGFGFDVVLSGGSKNINEQLNQLFEAVSEKSGVPVKLGFAPMNLLVRSAKADNSGSLFSARTALANLLDSTHANLVYEALYDDFTNCFLVNIGPAIKNSYDAAGGKSQSILKVR